MKDFENSIHSLVGILEADPEFVVENIDKLRAYDSQLMLMVKMEDEEPVYSSNVNLDESLNDLNKIIANSKIENALDSSGNSLIIDKVKFDGKQIRHSF